MNSQDPTPPQLPNDPDRERKRAIFSAGLIAVLSGTIVPLGLHLLFGLPVVGGLLPAVAIYLLLQRVFNFDPKCPGCGIAAAKSATRCRSCGAPLGE